MLGRLCKIRTAQLKGRQLQITDSPAISGLKNVDRDADRGITEVAGCRLAVILGRFGKVERQPPFDNRQGQSAVDSPEIGNPEPAHRTEEYAAPIFSGAPHARSSTSLNTFGCAPSTAVLLSTTSSASDTIAA